MTSEHDPDIAHVIASEQRLLDRAVRSSPDAVRGLLDPEFHEFGASGRVWDLDAIVTMMATDDDYERPEVDRMRATRLADDVILLTFRSRLPERTAVRSSLWRRRAGRWRAFFHQGTVQPPHLQDPRD